MRFDADFGNLPANELTGGGGGGGGGAWRPPKNYTKVNTCHVGSIVRSGAFIRGCAPSRSPH